MRLNDSKFSKTSSQVLFSSQVTSYLTSAVEYRCSQQFVRQRGINTGTARVTSLVIAGPLWKHGIDVNRLTVGTALYKWAYERVNIEAGVKVCWRMVTFRNSRPKNQFTVPVNTLKTKEGRSMSPAYKQYPRHKDCNTRKCSFYVFFIYCSFSEPLSNPQYIASNVWMSINNDLERM